MTTKERITDEALTLFSIKGFKGTSVKNIADAVGIKDSSLYKHFKSKNEIFDTIIQIMRDRMEHLSVVIGLPDNPDMSQAAETYGKISVEELIGVSKKVYLFYLEDPFVSRFWRMATIEQYQNAEIYEIYRHIFMEESITYLTSLFEEMMRQDIFYSGSAEVMAMNFYTPIFFLLSKYAGRPKEKEKALEVLENQILEFCRIYRK